MNLLIVGDVHGCYHTLKLLVKTHWDPKTQILIQIGDLINKGPHSGKCLKYWNKLETKYPGQVILLKGNHEHLFVEGHLDQEAIGEMTLEENILQAGLKPKKIKSWLDKKPLKWENDHILITHAGINKSATDPYAVNNRNSVLYNKGSLKRLEKVQVKGHSIVDGNKPLFVPSENAWYIDTGAWVKKYLSALVFSEEGNMLKVIRIPTQPEDKLL